MKRLFRWLRYPALVFTALLIAAGCANRVPNLPVPPNVTKRTEKLVLQGQEKPVDIYLPQNVEKAPVVIVSHGFTRHRRVMAGLGNPARAAWHDRRRANSAVLRRPDRQLPGDRRIDRTRA
jgi:poly(3-hydroxybutyrate) depolymerase